MAVTMLMISALNAAGLDHTLCKHCLIPLSWWPGDVIHHPRSTNEVTAQQLSGLTKDTKLVNSSVRNQAHELMRPSDPRSSKQISDLT